MEAIISETRVTTLDEGISAVCLRLREFERKHGQTSEEFYGAYSQGVIAPSRDHEAWASEYELYQHLVIRRAEQLNEGVLHEAPSFSSSDLALAELAA